MKGPENLIISILFMGFISSIVGIAHSTIIEQQNSAQTIEQLQQEVKLLKALLKQEQTKTTRACNLLSTAFRKPMDDFTIQSVQVTVTAYSASVDETNSEPWITADRTPSRIGIVGVSHDLRDDLGIQIGDTVLLPDYGMFRVHDAMSTHKRKNTKNPIPITRTVDILHASKKAARLFGIQHNKELIFIQHNGE
jgi:3D (Asp-Asp-Asp) domain-containing protein